MRTPTLLLALFSALLLLCFLPFAVTESLPYVELLAYASVVLPIYLSIERKQLELVSLLLVATLTHIVKSTCINFEGVCMSSYSDLQWDTLSRVVTIFSILHLALSASLSKKNLEIAGPVILLTSLIAVFSDIEVVFIVVVVALSLVRIMGSLNQYYVADLVAFLITSGLALVFYNVSEDGERRFFQLLYSLAFAFNGGIRRRQNDSLHFLQLLSTKESGYTLISGQRIDLQ